MFSCHNQKKTSAFFQSNLVSERNIHLLMTHALIDLVETIRKALDDNEFTCGVFPDFKNAFDTMKHKISLKKT